MRSWPTNTTSPTYECALMHFTAENTVQSQAAETVPEINRSTGRPSLEGLMLRLKLQYFGSLMRRANSMEKTLMLGKTEGRRRRGQQRMRWLDGITDSMEKTLGDSEGQGSLAYVVLEVTKSCK